MTDPYRGETEALRHRVVELEDELAAAHGRIAKLEGAPTSPSTPSGLGAKMLGAPTLIELERTLEDGELPVEAHEELLEVVTRNLGAIGHASTVGRSFTYNVVNQQSGQVVEISVRPSKGRTVIRLRERLGGLAGGLFGGIVGGVGGGGMAGVIAASLALGAGGLTPAICVVWVATIWMVVRAAFGAVVRGRRRKLEALARELEASCASLLQGAGPRVAGTPDDVDERAELEAVAEEEAARVDHRSRRP